MKRHAEVIYHLLCDGAEAEHFCKIVWQRGVHLFSVKSKNYLGLGKIFFVEICILQIEGN